MAVSNKFFGIYQDGYLVKVAVLTGEKDSLRISHLESIKLTDNGEQEYDDSPLEDALESLSFGIELGSEPEKEEEKEEIDDNSLDDALSMTDLSENDDEDKISTEQKTLENLANQLGFETGTLSLNLDFNNVVYKDLKISSKAGRRKILSEISKQFYDDGSPSVLTLSYFQRKDGSVVGISHEKNMELLENVILVNRSLSKKRYHYSYIQPNEISLLNALRLNFNVQEDDISAIINISNDHTQVLLTKGYDFLADLPVINEGAKSKDIIRTVISRIMLERSHLEIGTINNYFIAGEGAEERMLASIKKREAKAEAALLIPNKLCERTDYSGIYGDQTLAEYIIPITMAMVAALPKAQGLIRANFLPKQLKEQQNIFSISTLGLVTLGVILISGLFGIQTIFRQQTANSGVMLDNSRISSQISVSRTRLDSLYAISTQISEIEKNIARSQQLLGEKNQWHFIIEQISNTFRASHLSWLTSMKSEPNGFRVTGQTNNRYNIIELSKLFPGSIIHYITEDEIENNTVWSFQISFKYPDPLETKRINYQRETGTTYEQ